MAEDIATVGRAPLVFPDGAVQTVPLDQVERAKAELGARDATDVEYFGAQTGLGGEVAAGVLGAARGVTFGLSDKAYVEGARAFADDDTADETRELLRLYKAASPRASFAGEIAGAIAPAVATGGLTLGATAGRAAKIGLGAVEGAGFGAAAGMGAQLTEDTLENHALVGEAYLSAGVKGGAIGLLLGAAGAGAGQLFGRARRAAPTIEQAAMGAEREALPVGEAAAPFVPGQAEGAFNWSVPERVDFKPYRGPKFLGEDVPAAAPGKPVDFVMGRPLPGAEIIEAPIGKVGRVDHTLAPMHVPDGSEILGKYQDDWRLLAPPSAEASEALPAAVRPKAPPARAADPGVTSLEGVRIDADGMRPESFERVRAQRAAGEKMRPIEISFYPGEQPVVTDGRHRIAVARELGDDTILATRRIYDAEGSTVSKVTELLPLREPPAPVAAPSAQAAVRAEEAAAPAGRKTILERVEGLRDELTYNATGATKKDVHGLGANAAEQAAEQQRLGRVLREQIDVTAAQSEIDRQIIAKQKSVGASLGAMYKEADAAAARPAVDELRRGWTEVQAKYAGKMYEGDALREATKAFAELEKTLGKNPTHSKLWEASKVIGDRLNFEQVESVALGKKALRDLYEVTRGELRASVDRASAELGGTLGDRIRSANSLYSDLSTLSETSARAARKGPGDTFTLKDAVLFGAAAMTGQPAAVGAVGLNVARRKYGNQVGAHVLNDLAHNETFQRAAAKLDEMIDSGAKAFATNSKAASRAPKTVTTAEVRALREATLSPGVVSDRVAERLGDMPAVAPKIAQQIATTAARAAAWLQKTLPREAVPSTPTFGRPREMPLSDEQLIEARATIETIEDGSIVVDRLRQNRLTQTHVDTLKFVHPETFNKIRTYLTRHATELNATLTQQQLTQLSMLFGTPLSEADLPENVRAFQASFVQGNQAPGRGGAGGDIGMSAMSGGPVKGGGTRATATDKLEAG
jgi:hypothetical protein